MTSSSSVQGEHYNLRWNNYFTNLVQVFAELRQKEQMVDVTLVCENQQIKAHKVILSACSGFFMDLFQTLKGNQPLIIFHEIKFLHLKHIINFLYQGEVKVLDVDLEGVLILGEKFQVKGLSSVKLKHKVTNTESEDEIFKNHEVNKHSLRYEIKSSDKPCSTYKSNKIIANSSNNINKATIIKSQPTIPKNKMLYDSNSAATKKIKLTPTFQLLNQEEKLDKELFENSSNGDISYEQKLKKNNIHSLKTNMVTVLETINLTDDIEEKPKLNDFTNLGEKSLKNISNKSLEYGSTSTDSAISSKTNQLEIKKPVNAFIIFSKEWRKKLEVEHPKEDYKSISVRLGNLWKSLTSETRESYYMAAREEQLNYQLKSCTTEK